jgi:hypothetical protein
MKFWLLFACSICLAGCDPCGDIVLGNSVSPDATHVATIYERSCGATTPDMIVVQLRANGSRFRSNDFSRIIFSSRYEKVAVTWITPRAVRIECERCGTASGSIKRYRWNDIEVSYGSLGHN